jgi:hypothetical protein
MSVSFQIQSFECIPRGSLSWDSSSSEKIIIRNLSVIIIVSSTLTARCLRNLEDTALYTLLLDVHVL